MKIFDFTNGRKGEELGWAKRPDFCADSLVERDGEIIKLKSGRYQYHNAAGTGLPGKEKLINPSDYNVDAICFCLGSFRCGDEEIWEWCYLTSTPELGYELATTFEKMS